MKFTQSIMLTLALIMSLPATASWYDKNKIGVACIAATTVILSNKRTATQDELDEKRSILDEKKVIDTCLRFVNEEVIGQLEDKDKPATGMVGKGHKVFMKNILPFLGTILVLEKTREKLSKGLKSFGLEWIMNYVPEIPSLASNEKALSVNK